MLNLSLNLEPWRFSVILICVGLLLGGGADALFGMGTLGYTSGYEGVRASFSGIDYQSGTDPRGKADLTGLSFYFDSDNPTLYAPNLIGEMTNAFVPKSSITSWVFPELLQTENYIENPIAVTEWNLPNPEKQNEIIAYIMEEWILRMYVSITAEWDESTDLFMANWEKSGDTRYHDTRIWIELDVSPIWYFEGADQVYFGLAKVVTSDVARGKLGTTDEDYTPTSKYSVAPSSATSYRYLYNAKYASVEITPEDPKTYQGRILNPEIFRDKMYIKLDLNNFGTEMWGTPLTGGYNYKGDAVTWGFDIHVFVVGEWRVQDIEEIPEDYGREPMQEYGLGYYIGKFLADPRGQFWLIVGALAIVFLILAIFAPWVLMAIFSMLGLILKRNGGRKQG